MSYFESLLLLSILALVLLQLARRSGLPYPTLLAAAGAALAFLPGLPNIALEPETALAIFIAPAIVSAAYDFPSRSGKRVIRPLVVLIVGAVLITATAVASLAHTVLHVSWAAGFVLGAIVAPPDAAAADAVLKNVSIPRDTEAVLKGESLFNDASALLLFEGALLLVEKGRLESSAVTHLALAVPGGVVLGIALAFVFREAAPFVRDSLAGGLLQFLSAFVAWVLATRLGLSAVLCTIAFARMIAKSNAMEEYLQMRVHSRLTWNFVVFTLNVFAFLLMGMQARSIVLHMAPRTLANVLLFELAVVITVILLRIAISVGFNRSLAFLYRARNRPEPASWQQALLVGWSGMRGFVTLATAFALPQSFPQRDDVVLTAFSVVLSTLVLQGGTLSTLIRRLGLDRSEARAQELSAARYRILSHALLSAGPHEEKLRVIQLLFDTADSARRHVAGLLQTERSYLKDLERQDSISESSLAVLNEELDWRELAFAPEGTRNLEEI